MKKTVLFFFCVLLLAIVPTSCAPQGADLERVLNAVIATQTAVPAGRIYYSSRGEDDTYRLDDTLAAILWGNGTLPAAYRMTSSAAIYLSSREAAFEAEILECISTSAASEVAYMCSDRLAEIYRTDSERTPYSVAIYGRYVVALICPDPQTAQKAAAKALRSAQSSDTTQ